jgi:hypothetical protein
VRRLPLASATLLLLPPPLLLQQLVLVLRVRDLVRARSCACAYQV